MYHSIVFCDCCGTIIEKEDIEKYKLEIIINDNSKGGDLCGKCYKHFSHLFEDLHKNYNDSDYRKIVQGTIKP